MTKKVKSNSSNTIATIEVLAALIAVFYLQSVLTVANHVSEWTHNGTLHHVGPPNAAALVIALLFCGYSAYKRRGVSIIVAVVITILATSSIFWLSGLRTNFYF